MASLVGLGVLRIRMQAVGYIRVSTDRQELGAVAQAQAIERWCVREGHILVAVYVDRDVCSADEDKPGLTGALGHVKGRVLVAAVRDRFARDTMLMALLGRAVVKAGGILRTADGMSGEGPEAQLMAGIIDCFAAYELARIRGRVKAALGVLKSRGYRVGGVSYGTVEDMEGRLVRDEEEVKAIERARDMRSRGKSLRVIARTLNQMGGGRLWHPEAVRRVCGGQDRLPRSATSVGSL